MFSVRRRATATLVLGFAVVLLGVGVAAAGLVARGLQDEFDVTLLSKARALIALTDQEDGQIELDYGPGVMPEFEREDEPEFFQFWLDDGTVLYRSARLGDDLLTPHSGVEPRFEDLALPDGRRGRAVSLAFVPGAIVDALDADRSAAVVAADRAPSRGLMLAVARQREGLDALIARLRLGVFASAGLATLLAAVFAWAALGAAFRPIDTIARQVAALDAGALQQRVDPARTPSEIAPVVTQLNDLLGRLHLVLERERRFTSHVAHELRTPIAELKSLAAVAARWPDDVESVRAFFTDVGEVAGRMGAVIADLFLLARCQAGVEAAESGTVDLRAELARVWSELTAADAATAAIGLRVDGPAEALVETDAGKLSIVLRNLLHNAASHGASADAPIDCAVRETAAGFEIEVVNCAPPIDASSLERLTEAFWRGDAARSGDGAHAGLGLTLVAALVDLLELELHLSRGPDGRFHAVLRGFRRVDEQPRAGRARTRSRRRSPMKHGVISLVFACVLGACDAGRSTAPPTARGTDLPIQNDYFPLTPGSRWLYVGVKDGEVVEELVTIRDGERRILGVDCRPVVQEVRVEGELDHITTEWFAVDAGGDVWKFGEQTFERSEAGWVEAADSWVADQRDGFAWLFLPARPRVGQVLTGYGPLGPGRTEVLATGVTEQVEAGAFASCVAVAEVEDDPDDTDIILYAPGVGRVSETNGSGRIELVVPALEPAIGPR